MTTITTAKLREMAHTLGTTPAALKNVIWSMFGVTIDDTPADTEEHDMATMTITQEQYGDVCRAAALMGGRFVPNEGTTIAPVEPPAEMVRLVACVVQQAIGKQQIAPSERSVQDMEAGALAMAQHVVGVVKAQEQAHPRDNTISRAFTLTALGAA